MKKLLTIIGLALCVGVTLTTGCAHVVKKSATAHYLTQRAVALPPGWTLVAANNTLALPLSENSVLATFANSATGYQSGLLAVRPVAFDVLTESWTDSSKGGGTFLFTDPQASQISSGVSNQAALAGSHQFSVGTVSSTITSNAVSAITAGASGVGNIIGAAAKAASGTP